MIIGNRFVKKSVSAEAISTWINGKKNQFRAALIFFADQCKKRSWWKLMTEKEWEEERGIGGYFELIGWFYCCHHAICYSRWVCCLETFGQGAGWRLAATKCLWFLNEHQHSREEWIVFFEKKNEEDQWRRKGRDWGKKPVPVEKWMNDGRLTQALGKCKKKIFNLQEWHRAKSALILGLGIHQNAISFEKFRIFWNKRNFLFFLKKKKIPPVLTSKIRNQKLQFQILKKCNRFIKICIWIIHMKTISKTIFPIHEGENDWLDLGAIFGPILIFSIFFASVHAAYQ